MVLGNPHFELMHEAAVGDTFGLWRPHVETAIDASAVDCWRQDADGDVVPWHLHFDDRWIEFAPVGELAAVRWHDDVPNYEPDGPAGRRMCLVLPTAESCVLPSSLKGD